MVPQPCWVILSWKWLQNETTKLILWLGENGGGYQSELGGGMRGMGRGNFVWEQHWSFGIACGESCIDKAYKINTSEKL